MVEDEMIRYHHWLNGHEFEQSLGDGEGSLEVWKMEPGVLQSMGSQRIGHDLATKQQQEKF